VAKHSLNPLDASWLLVESAETPMHVGALMPFSLPEDAPEDFVGRIMADFRAATAVAAPWNRRLYAPRMKGLVPLWEEVDSIDLEHHVHHSSLPAPGGERELGQLIARLHSQPLDLTRPPWEVELIEGLEGGRFALYAKVHHSLMDGIAGVRLLLRAMASESAASRRIAPFWTITPPARPRREERAPATVAQIASQLLDTVRDQAGSLPTIARAFGAMIGALRNKQDVLQLPFDTPVSVLNGRIRGPRRFATQRVELARLKALSQASDATLNDVVLALCGGALRRFLSELGELPDKPLTAGIPCSVRLKDEAGDGNAITFIIATLGTDIDDPVERLAAIRASTRRAKQHVQGLPRQAMTQYTLLLMAPYVTSLLTGIGGRTRPMFNITISNVPGPERPLYFRGARMEASYPVSLVSHGQALNITCQSYAGYLHFGFTGCRDSLPHMQRIATYTGEALDELEQRLLPARRAGAEPAAAAPRRKTAARKAVSKPAKKVTKKVAKKATSRPARPAVASQAVAKPRPAAKTPAGKRPAATATRRGAVGPVKRVAAKSASARNKPVQTRPTQTKPAQTAT
jgi:diacylglycerol O-acyltransferase / wax synthase